MEPLRERIAYAGPDDLVFGEAKKPLTCGFGLTIGGGVVHPEVKYTLPPMQVTEATFGQVRAEYRQMVEMILRRALELEVPGICLEFEHVYEMTYRPEWGAAITEETHRALAEARERHGLASALRVTVADIRDRTRPPRMRTGEELRRMEEAFARCARAGAHILSIESTGGKEVCDAALVEGDLAGVLFGAAVLGSRDMEFLWKRIGEIARAERVIPGGDSDCGHANTAMQLADQRFIPRVFAALVRVIGAVRSLVAYEQGAVGPSKDCAYEGPYLKAVLGIPISMEGKSSACAHFSRVGNVAAAYCDLWSNESVQKVKLLSGFAPEVFTEILAYDCRLLNEARRGGQARALRDLLVRSDAPLDPQAYLMTPDRVLRVARVIGGEGTPYERALGVARLAADELRRGVKEGQLRLRGRETEWLDRLARELEGFPDEERFCAEAAGPYRDLFIPAEYAMGGP